jgi:hypothetical protein
VFFTIGSLFQYPRAGPIRGVFTGLARLERHQGTLLSRPLRWVSAGDLSEAQLYYHVEYR